MRTTSAHFLATPQPALTQLGWLWLNLLYMTNELEMLLDWDGQQWWEKG